MQTITLPQAETRSALAPAAGSQKVTPTAAQEVLLPFLSELSKVDARNQTAREDAEDGLDSDAAGDQASGLSGATSTMRARVDAGERRIGAASRAQRQLQASADMRQEVAQRQEARQRALDKQADESGPSASGQRRAAPRPPTNGQSRESASDSPRAQPAPRDASGRERSVQPAGDSRTASAPASNSAQSQSPSDAGRAAPVLAAPSAAPKQSAESAVKPIGSGRATTVETVRAAAAPSPADGKSANARAGMEPALQHPAKRDAGPLKAAARGAATADPGKNDANVKQLLRVIRSRINGPNSHMTMRLEPASLGSIRISIDLHEQSMHLRIETESQLAHRLLSGNAESLREALKSSGISLERFEVRPQPPTQDAQDAAQRHDVDQERSGDGSAQANAERSPDQRESESPDSFATADSTGEDEVERSTESSLNVLA